MRWETREAAALLDFACRAVDSSRARVMRSVSDSGSSRIAFASSIWECIERKERVRLAIGARVRRRECWCGWSCEVDRE